MNTDISNDTLAGLNKQWRTDVLNAKPNIVSILIGINDTKYQFSFGHDEMPADVFQTKYQQLLKPLANIQLVLIEPFLLPIKKKQWAWRPDLNAKIQIIQKLAQKFETRLVTADELFAELAAGNKNPKHWLFDGIHPTPTSHAALTNAWLRQLTSPSTVNTSVRR